MPCIGKIHVIKITGSGDELLGSCSFFCRTSVVADRSVLSVVDQIVLKGYRGGKASCSEQVVPAAVSAASGDDRFSFRLAGLLAESVKSVILSQESNDRFSAACLELCQERCRYLGYAGSDGEAFRRKRIFQFFADFVSV